MKFLGDVFLDKVYAIDMDLDDGFILNLEYPFSTVGTPAENKVNLGADESFFEQTFKNKRPIAVDIANNHIMDYGEEAFSKTIDYLEKYNISFFGAGNEENNFNNPAIVEHKGKKIALLGYSCPTTHPVYGGKESNGSALLDDVIILEDIRRFKESADMLVLNLHWGDEEIKYPKPSDVMKARSYIDAGVDLIIGHHAHVIQSLEQYKGKYIFYGLGNFIFPDFSVPAYHDGDDFRQVFSKQQNRLNKQGLVVQVSEDFEITYQTAVFDGDGVSIKDVGIPQWIPKSEKRYRQYYKFWSKLRMLELYLKNPRIPSIRQVKLFLNIKGIK